MTSPDNDLADNLAGLTPEQRALLMLRMRQRSAQRSDGEAHGETARYDLLLSISDQEGALPGYLEYSTDLFDAPTVRRIVGHFATLLSGIAAGLAADPERRLSELPAERLAFLLEDSVVVVVVEEKIKDLKDIKDSKDEDNTGESHASLSFGSFMSFGSFASPGQVRSVRSIWRPPLPLGRPGALAAWRRLAVPGAER